MVIEEKLKIANGVALRFKEFENDYHVVRHERMRYMREIRHGGVHLLSENELKTMVLILDCAFLQET